MPSIKYIILLCICLSVSPVVWGSTGLIVQTIVPAAGDAMVYGNTIAASIPSLGGSNSPGTTIYTKDSSGSWQLSQNLSVAGPLALSNSELILGNRTGALFQANPSIIYTSTGNGVWTEQASLVAPDVTTCDWFGAAVAIGGDIAVVGALNHGGGAPDPFCHPGNGAAYVFQHDATGTWMLAAELLPPPDQSTFDFGQMVAVSAGTVLVNATNMQTASGETFVYTQVGGGSWALSSVLSGPDLFGSMAINGDQIALQAEPLADGYTPVSIFAQSAPGNWLLTQSLFGASIAATGEPGQSFGSGIALSNSLLLVVADGDSTLCPPPIGPPSPCQTLVTQGGLYAYIPSAGQWQPVNVYAPANMNLTALVGGVSTDGVTAIVGAPQGFAVMQLGNVPPGYVVVPSFQPAPSAGTSPNPPSPTPPKQTSPGSGGGGLGVVALVLLILLSQRRLWCSSETG